MRDQHISLKNSPRRFSRFRSLPPLLDNARQCEQGGVVSGAYFLHRVLELHATVRSSFARPVPVDPKVLSVRRSAGMVAGAPALPRLKYFIATTFFRVVLAVVAALSATL